MANVGIVEGVEEAIGCFIRTLCILVVEHSLHPLNLPNKVPIELVLANIFVKEQLLDGDSSESFEDFLEVMLFRCPLVDFVFFQFLPDCF